MQYKSFLKNDVVFFIEFAEENKKNSARGGAGRIINGIIYTHSFVSFFEPKLAEKINSLFFLLRPSLFSLLPSLFHFPVGGKYHILKKRFSDVNY